MKKTIIVSCLMLSAVKLFGQQYSQYNTGTLYDSFENPSQRSFIPDSSRSIASNFFIPNFSGNLIVTGNAQDAVLDRIFSGYYNTAAVEIGKSKYSNIRSSANVYLAMVKVFTSLNGNQELGFSMSTKTDIRGSLTDESVALFNGPMNFNQLVYSNLFNSKYSYQAYHQFSFAYREQVAPRFAFGVKLSALLGIAHSDITIDQSSIIFDPDNETGTLTLQGVGKTSGPIRAISLDNPGAAITIGTGFSNREGYNFQVNLKDLGIIKWAGQSYTSQFNNSGTILDITSTRREQNLIDVTANITSRNKRIKPFYSPTNALLEASVNKSYMLDYDRKWKLSPTLVGSKELFYQDATIAAVVPVSYNNYTITGTASYNTMGLFNWGGQFMYKTPNAEFFIGTERLYQTARAVKTAFRNNNQTPRQVVRSTGVYSGADIFLGVSFKFGNVIEHPMNASWVPNGEDQGFFGKMWNKIFKGKDKNY